MPTLCLIVFSAYYAKNYANIFNVGIVIIQLPYVRMYNTVIILYILHDNWPHVHL